jgi:hypothetical protein
MQGDGRVKPYSAINSSVTLGALGPSQSNKPILGVKLDPQGCIPASVRKYIAGIGAPNVEAAPGL